MNVNKDELSAKKTHAVIPFDITAAYIFAMLVESKPNSIKVVGFDGYEKNDPRQQEMLTIFGLYAEINIHNPIISLTPTSYPINKGSIYAPNI